MADPEQSEIERLSKRVRELEQAQQRMRQVLRDRTAEADEALGSLSTIIDSITDAIVVCDIDGAVRLVNPAVRDLFSLTGHVVGRPAAAVLPQIAALVEQTRQGPVLTELSLPRGRVGAAVVSPVFGDTGDWNGAVAVIRDVSRERELAQLKREFIANVSHELRTPLTSIRGFATLLEGRLPDLFAHIPAPSRRVQRQMDLSMSNLDIVVQETERLTRLVNTLIDYAELQAGRLGFVFAPMRLDQVLRDVVTSLSPRIRPGLSIRIGGEPTPEIRGDTQRLGEVVAHLLDNALKFTPEGEVLATTRPTSDGVQLSIHDAGPGIPADQLEAVFVPFGQIGEQLTDKPVGTGLGLPFCRDIVDAHGGRLWAENAKPGGAIFHLSLPGASGEG